MFTAEDWTCNLLRLNREGIDTSKRHVLTTELPGTKQRQR
jgi:hypothetical protein